MNNLAPITLFVYNRLEHTKKTILALQANPLAEKSDLIIYSDGPKNNSAIPHVKAVRDYLITINGFRTLKIVERENNWGLAKSVISGVTEIVNQYGKIIVLEDDIVTSPKYLNFMNSALNFYEGKEEVWHISGWTYPIEFPIQEDVFFWRGMNCWGWATWNDRWSRFEKNPNRLIESWSDKQKRHFDLHGSGVFWSQVVENASGNLNTWAIFWYATIYEHEGLCLNPRITYVENIGLDGSGENCEASQGDIFKAATLNLQDSFIWTENLTESQVAVSLIEQFYINQKKTILTRIINKLTRLIIKRNVF